MIEVIPVLDIMNGLVVHAYAGRRDEYKPLKNSSVIEKPDPYLALRTFKEMGFRTVYIADLDAIMNRGENSRIINEAARLGFKVITDVGKKGLRLKDTDKIDYVIGTEYIEYPNEINSLDKRAISLDLFGNEVIFSNTRISLDNAIEHLARFEFKEILIIDLSRVGTERGVNKTIVSKLTRCIPGKIIVGGGVKNEEDVLELRDLGVIGVLVATAIHKGVIRRPLY